MSKDITIEVSGQVISQQQQVRLWLYYKPVGLLITHKDPKSRATVFENLPGLPRVISVGRLELNSEGLLLLTNNGDLARKLELPANTIERIYRVRTYRYFALLLKNYKNIIIEQIRYDPKSVKLIKTTGTNNWFEVILTEEKNREIRKIFEYCGLQVNRLIRIRYDSFILGNLQPNEYKEVNIKKFQKFL